jgi:hypothetical protein
MNTYRNYKSKSTTTKPVESDADKFKKMAEKSLIDFEVKGTVFNVVLNNYRDEMIKVMDSKFMGQYNLEEDYDWKMGKSWMTFNKK